MAKRDRFKEWVLEFCTNLEGHLNLAGWRVEIDFTTKAPEDSLEVARAQVLTPYLQAYIQVHPIVRQWFRKKEYDSIIRILVHEYVHILLDPFYTAILPHLSDVTRPLFIDMQEQRTQTITMILLKTLPPSLTPKTK